MSSDGFGPTALIVSGRAAPDSPPQDVPVHALPTPALWSRVAAWGGLQDAIGSDPITREFFELILRADLRLAETYQPSPAKRLACPILGVAGLSDPWAPPQTMYRWREVTTGRVAIETLPGTHFFPFTHRPQFLRLVSRALEEA
jgi:pyochelin biosynthetic protein PchC